MSDTGTTIQDRAKERQDTDADNAAAKTQEQLDELRDGLQIGDSVDPLDALLSIDKNPEDVREDVPLTLIGGVKTVFTIRALTGPEIDACEDSSTEWVRRGRGPKVKEVDNQRFSRSLIALATVTPDLNDQRLFTKFGVRTPEKVVEKALMPGVWDGLSMRILELSGYSDDLVALGKS